MKKLIAIAVILALAGAGWYFFLGPGSRITAISSSFVAGALVMDEVSFTNDTGKDLTEVNLTLTVYGDRGEVKTHTLYWAVWKAGESKVQKLPKMGSDGVAKVEKYELTGTSDQGQIYHEAIPGAQ